jgi:hypothetical protein
MSFIDLLDEESLSTKKIKTLYEGNLNFSIDHPIEGIFNYETESIQKVYWVDGINPLRIINIAATEGVKNRWTETSFDINIKTPYISNKYV